jgi:NADPH:quinone reductase-like Zn-dependent oxidoreductase
MKAMALISTNTFRYRDDFPEPEEREGYTTIRVSHVGLNRLDLLLADGELSVPLPHICGSDVVGVTASASDRFELGTRVLVNPAFPQEGDEWPPGREVPFVRILGAHTQGGLAEFLSVPDAQLYELPPGLTDAEAATLPLDFLTAWRMLMTKAGIREGERVLVWGASGALGCAAVRICRAVGANAVAVGSRPRDEEALRAIGAESFLNYAAPDFAAALRQSAGEGFDVVFESVGAESWRHTIETVAQSGRVVISGVTTGAEGVTDLEELYYKQITVYGSRMGYPAEFEEMLAEVEAGRLLPLPIARQFPFSSLPNAMEALRHREAPGKVVLRNDL